MDDQQSIPTSKIGRAAEFVKASGKVGANYVKHYSKRIFDQSLTKEDLHKENAADIYQSLSKLKGSALKMAQMMSMDRNLLPKAYSDKFSMAQYSAPPMSAPLVLKTFQSTIGKSPSEIFDTFNTAASNAASIGQVHKATLKGETLAVKVQYPGVGDSISSDLKMARPLAVQLLNLNNAEIERYFKEVEQKLLEEANYELEIERSVFVSEKCSHIPNLYFPKYYPEFSSNRIITMSWLEGMHMKEFLATNPSQTVRNQIGQALWDFYHYQIHTLRMVHADPHPGNFIFNAEGKLGIFDFGCIKVIPSDFYDDYFALINPNILQDRAAMDVIFRKLEFILREDSLEMGEFFFEIFYKMIEMLSRPFTNSTFDFGEKGYVEEVYGYFEYVASLKELKNANAARGSQHALYINRTFFGLYTLLHDLGAKVNVEVPDAITN
jgi:predicted unusual protein kinase regulating ubiquinone biosynthesis (AarF/ABC1/UbiB family)